MPRQLGAGGVLPRLAVLTLLLSVVTASLALGEASDARSSVHYTPKRASLDHLYWHLLLYQNYLDRKVATLEQEGRTKDAATLRNHFQKDLHFTNAQFAIVRQAGLQLEKDLDAVQAKVRPIVYQDRQWIKLHGRSDGPPPGHSQVQQLQKEHEAVIHDAVAHLNQKLGPKSAATVQTYIENEWASHVTAHEVHPRPHDPKDLPVAPQHLEARQ
jgi:hypothetical protein